MHFSIPETTQATDDNGGKYWNFHIHVNGVYHCKLRYSQMDKFYEQLKSEFTERLPNKIFPGKKIFALSVDQLEERREQLEKFVQQISQDPIVGVSDAFNDFFLKAQQNSREVAPEDVVLDVYLMNGNKVSIGVSSTDQTDDVLDAAMKKIGLAEKFFYYFALFLVEQNKSGGISIVRKLQDFESPYLSLKSVEKPHRIVIRKNYWSAKYDDEIIEDRIAMNLLYVQISDDLERGWMLCSDAEKTKLDKLQADGLRKEVLNLAKSFKFYGYVHYRPCIADYPKEKSRVLMCSGGREFNIRVKQEGEKIMEGSFKVQRIRSWRLSSIPLTDTTNSSGKKETLQFAFEYLFTKTDLRWITIESDQAIMMSMAMQGMVDEILREQQNKGIRQPRPNKGRTNSTSSSSSDQSLKQQSSTSQETNTTTKKTKLLLIRSNSKDKTPKVRFHNSKKGVGVNEVFAEDDGIGDNDL